MAESLVFSDSQQPIGSLADYSISATAVPQDPSASQGQLPTFTATVTDLQGSAKALPDADVTLTDWLGEAQTTVMPHTISGRVAAMTKGASGLASLDVSTFFERLNTEQTTYPILDLETTDTPAATALEHWLLMARIPSNNVQGKILHFIGKSSPYGLSEDSTKVWRSVGDDGSGNGYINYALNTPYYPTAGAYVPALPLDVNLSQGLVLGMSKGYQSKVTAILNDTKETVTYTLKASGSTWEFKEKVGAAAEVTKLTASGVTTDAAAYGMLLVKANTSDTTKVDLTLRVYTYTQSVYAGYVTTYTDYTATGVVSSLRRRPTPYLLSKGFDPADASGKPAPANFFLLQESTLQAQYPLPQATVNVPANGKLPLDIPGFTGNVWENLNTFCSMFDLDIDISSGISISPRSLKLYTTNDPRDFIPAKPFTKAGIGERLQKRDGARAVEVKYRTNIGNSSNNGVMFKATDVYSLEKGETKVEVVQTNNTMAYVESPIPVSGVPVPYTSTYGSYVVTGNDGYIVDPQWWTDNGGSITAELTGVSGEIKLTMQAPTVDTVRAPYRISEGVADRPALYIWGHGLVLSEPVTKKVYTGNPRASQEVGTTFDSPFTTSALIAQNVGLKVAEKYSSMDNVLTFTIPKDGNLFINGNTIMPLGNYVYWDGSYYRVSQQTIGPKSIQIGEAPDSNLIAVVNGEFAEEKKISDWNALHLGKLVKDTNAAPLPKYES